MNATANVVVEYITTGKENLHRNVKLKEVLENNFPTKVRANN